jgi:hypothetical protein
MTGYTRIHEWRIIVPTSLPQYRIGSRYMVSRIARDDKGGGEGIEDGERCGTDTHKVSHIRRAVPESDRISTRNPGTSIRAIRRRTSRGRKIRSSCTSSRSSFVLSGSMS